MPDPEVRERRFCNKIDRPLPFFEEICIDLETLQRRLGQGLEKGMGGAVLKGGAQDADPMLRRSLAARRVMAAGVIPSIRLACPIVWGRTRSSRALISLERPGMAA